MFVCRFSSCQLLVTNMSEQWFEQWVRLETVKIVMFLLGVAPLYSHY